MKKTITVKKAYEVYALLRKASFGNMSNADKFAVLAFTKVFRGIAEDFQRTLDDVEKDERLKPEGYAEAVEIINAVKRGEVKTQNEIYLAQEVVGNYRKAVNDYLTQEGKAERAFDYTPLRTDVFDVLVSANAEWKVEHLILLDEINN